MKKNLIIFGTRPEAIKMAPLIKEFQKRDQFQTKVCVTAQHREMLDQVLDFFEITPDYDLNLMKPNQNLYSLTSDIITGLQPILEEYKPDYVYVHGDTTTTMAASIASFYAGAKVCHVEAGLRTNNKKSPFPEEMNRQIAGRVADYHFVPTENSEQNLRKENIKENSIEYNCGDTLNAKWHFWHHHWYPATYRELGPSLGTSLLIPKNILEFLKSDSDGDFYLLGKMTMVDKRNFSSEEKVTELYSRIQI